MKKNTSSSRILLGHSNMYKYNELCTWLGGAKQEVRMEFSWKIFWTISNRLTNKMGGNN